ncbi:MAG: DUF3800 domain-containing protein [Chloroflexi bacterium]|nr:DUF3800 domain-containing protein [Chloroflexota bacterium]
MTTRLYCYVDESGQDTEGDLFVVSVIVADEARERIAQQCEKIEAATGKGRVKWTRSDYVRKQEYIRLILREPELANSLFFAVYRNSKEYFSLTVQTIARAIAMRGEKSYKATILIDGLPRSQQRRVGSDLRRLRVQIRKVRGMRKEENDALVRLADAICGFVRAAVEGNPVMAQLLEEGKRNGLLSEL